MDDHAPLSPSPTRGGAGEPAGPAVLVEHLSKDFDGLRAVDDVSFRIESGRIFGLMPHPEAYLFPTNHPRWTRERVPREGMGVAIFRNAVKYIKANR